MDLPGIAGRLLLILAIVALFPASAAAAAGTVSAGDACGLSGTTVLVTLSFASSEPAGNMDLSIVYDPSQVRVVRVIRGILSEDAIFDSNILEGEVKIGIVSTSGISGSGALAYLVFELVGDGGVTPVRIKEVMADHAVTMDPLVLEREDGSIEIVGGVQLSREAGRQVIFLDPAKIGGRIRTEGGNIRCDLCGFGIRIETEGLKESEGRLEGVVSGVTIVAPHERAELSFGSVEAWFEFTLPEYPLDGWFALTFSEEIDPALRSDLERAAERKGLLILRIPFLASIDHNYGRTGPATGYFSIPESLYNSLGGIEGLWFGHQSAYTPTELLKPERVAGPDAARQITLRVHSPEGLSIFALASAKVKSMADSEGGGSARPATPQTGLTLFFDMILSAATLSTGNLMVGGAVIFLIAIVIVLAIYFTRFRRW